MFFVALDSLVGGSLIGSTSLILPSYPGPQKVVMPLYGAAVFVYERDTTTEWPCFEDEHGSGVPVSQPLTTDIDGHVVDASGNQVFTGQPQELDVVVTGGGLPAPRTIRAGAIRDPISITDVHVVASDAAMLAIPGAHEGTVAVRTDLENEVFMNNGGASGTDADWTQIGFGDVLSVAGKTGVVTLASTDLTDTGVVPRASSPAGDPLGRTQVMQTSSIKAPSLAQFVFADDAPWGAKGDVIEISDAAITSGTNQVTTAQHTWTAADNGKVIEILGSVLATSATHPNQWAYIKVTAGNAFLFSNVGLTTVYNATTTVSGAVARFGTDDSAAVTAVGNAISAAGGGMVCFNPYKRYWFQGVTPAGNVTYDGMGATFYVSPVTSGSNPNGAFYNLAPANVSNVTWRNFKWIGHGQEPSYQVPIICESINNVRVYDCDLLPSPNTGQSFAPYGIFLTDVNGARIVNCTFTNVCSHAPPGTGTTGNPLNLSPGVHSDTYPASRLYVVGCRMTGFIGEGVDITTGASSSVPQTVPFFARIIGNDFEGAATGAGAGIDVELGGPGTNPTYPPADVVIANNNLTNCGIATARQAVVTDPTLLQRYAISGNTINNPLASGQGITYQGSYAEITGNVIRASLGINLDSGTGFIALTGDLTNGSPTVNNVSGGSAVTNGTQISGTGIPSGTYLLSGAGTTTWTLSQNFTGTTGTGLAFNAKRMGTDVECSNNDIHLVVQSVSPGTGYGIQATYIRNASWMNNRISFDSVVTNAEGIVTANCGRVSIEHNKIDYAPNRGIYLQSSNDMSVQWNKVYNPSAAGGSRAGIQCNGVTGTLNEFIGNKVTDDRTVHLMYDAISLNGFSGSSNTIVTNNVLSGWTHTAIDGLVGCLVCRNNYGYNPIGTVTVAVPATTVAVAAQPYDRTFYVTAGTSTCTMAIQGGPSPVIPIGAFAAIRVPAGKTVTPTYTNAPTWVVAGE